MASLCLFYRTRKTKQIQNLKWKQKMTFFGTTGEIKHDPVNTLFIDRGKYLQYLQRICIIEIKTQKLRKCWKDVLHLFFFSLYFFKIVLFIVFCSTSDVSTYEKSSWRMKKQTFGSSSLSNVIFVRWKVFSSWKQFYTTNASIWHYKKSIAIIELKFDAQELVLLRFRLSIWSVFEKTVKCLT